MSAFLVSRAGSLALPVVLEERPVRSLEIATNPVETGASITDHAFRKPTELNLQIAQEQPVETWRALGRLMDARTPITVVTGLDVYRSMFLVDVAPTRNAGNAGIFSGSVTLKEVQFAESARVAVARRPGQGNGIGPASGRAASAAGGAVPPDPSKAGDATTTVRAADTVHRGDVVTEEVPTTGTSPEAVEGASILKRIAG